MTSGWDGHYCEENFREVVFEIAIIIAISSIGLKKIESKYPPAAGGFIKLTAQSGKWGGCKNLRVNRR